MKIPCVKSGGFDPLDAVGKIRSYPRITPLGRFLRMSRLDQIPQLWNMLRGNISLVGPRPERSEFGGALSLEIPYDQLRPTVRPGITKCCQIRYRCGSSVEDAIEKLRNALLYNKDMSFGHDLLVFFQRIEVILWSESAK